MPFRLMSPIHVELRRRAFESFIPVFAQWKGQYYACAHRSGAMIDRSTKIGHKRPDDFHALPRSDVLRSGAVIRDYAFPRKSCG